MRPDGFPPSIEGLTDLHATDGKGRRQAPVTRGHEALERLHAVHGALHQGVGAPGEPYLPSSDVGADPLLLVSAVGGRLLRERRTVRSHTTRPRVNAGVIDDGVAKGSREAYKRMDPAQPRLIQRRVKTLRELLLKQNSMLCLSPNHSAVSLVCGARRKISIPHCASTMILTMSIALPFFLHLSFAMMSNQKGR